MYVPIGGIPQWIETADGDRGKPVLLFLHGGPGGSSRFASAVWKPWDEHFQVVHWDQRGAGLTFAKNGEAGCGPLSVARMTEDALEVATYLRDRFQRDRIVLVGHSWGSILGAHMILRRPEWFAAFVATGQLVNLGENERFNYARQCAQAERAGNTEALKALEEIGPPPYRDIAVLRVIREWADRLSTATGDTPQPKVEALPPGFGPDDFAMLMRGFAYTGPQLFAELGTIDLPALGTDFAVPYFCFMGTADQQTPCELAEAYFATVSAPRKAFVRFEGCHHFVVFNRPHAFLEQLLAHRVGA
ncbi:MAG: alpha/beta fold hydrolase [Rhizomicrobium sp.]